MANEKKKYPKVGGIWKDEESKRLSMSLSLAEPVTLKVKQGTEVVEVKLVPNAKGHVYFWLQKPEDELTALVANGSINEDVAAERKARLPDSLKYQIIFPPARS